MASLGKMFGAGEVATFMGLPSCDDLGQLSARVALIGAGCATPYASVGAYCAGAPAAIRAAGAVFAANLGHMNFDLGGVTVPVAGSVVDAGDLSCAEEDAAGSRALISRAVAQILARGAVPVVLGGDDSVPIPMLEAVSARGRDLTILQIDAHVDWRDEVDGERLGLSSTMRRASEMPHVKRIVQVGQRGIGSARMGDVDAARAWGVEFISARQVARDGIAAVVEKIPAGADVVVCLDLDALDPAIMPAVIGRTAGGLGYWQVIDLIAGVAGKARIVAADMVEFMPERDIDGLGAMTAAQLLAALLGILARAG